MTDALHQRTCAVSDAHQRHVDPACWGGQHFGLLGRRANLRAGCLAHRVGGRVALGHLGAEIGEGLGIARAGGVVRLHAKVFGGEAIGHHHIEFGERFHLPVEPVERAGAEAVGVALARFHGVQRRLLELLHPRRRIRGININSLLLPSDSGLVPSGLIVYPLSSDSGLKPFGLPPSGLTPFGLFFYFMPGHKIKKSRQLLSAISTYRFVSNTILKPQRKQSCVLLLCVSQA